MSNRLWTEHFCPLPKWPSASSSIAKNPSKRDFIQVVESCTYSSSDV